MASSSLSQTSPRAQPMYRSSGLINAARCMCVLMFFGVGLMVMGVLFTAISSNFDRDNHVNMPRTFGICFLSIGGTLILIGIIVICIAKINATDNATQNQNCAVPVTAYPPGQVLAPSGYALPPPGPVLAGYSETSLRSNHYTANSTSWQPMQPSNGILPPPIYQHSPPPSYTTDFGKPNYQAYGGVSQQNLASPQDYTNIPLGSPSCYTTPKQ